MGQRVLITGISRFLGGKLAQRLERDPAVDYIVGVDLDEPEVDLDRTEYVRADIRNPLIVKVLQAAEVDTVVHLSIVATTGSSCARETGGSSSRPSRLPISSVISASVKTSRSTRASVRRSSSSRCSSSNR